MRYEMLARAVIVILSVAIIFWLVAAR